MQKPPIRPADLGAEFPDRRPGGPRRLPVITDPYIAAMEQQAALISLSVMLDKPVKEVAERLITWQSTTPYSPRLAAELCVLRARVGLPMPWDPEQEQHGEGPHDHSPTG